ncbi:hypothetical protein C9374_007114 [Naegleria lovaniensis]|uniref:Dynein light intermediate chain n=1 Tax=Naegleria lovaniensis TaxID=51637 RepID=A0AA88H2Y8_NAELO|nr:uncharacterized protein C9374_007114 [Naegleria lovaniensis]KAG2393583.1 hypothetical protein C9374_007114 [Naegleria lovaniensis]
MSVVLGKTLNTSTTTSTTLSSASSLLEMENSLTNELERLQQKSKKAKKNSIWSSLSKHQKLDSKLQEGLRESCNVIFLGDEKNGQRSLIRRVQGKEISGEVYHDTLSIEYTFFKVTDLNGDRNDSDYLETRNYMDKDDKYLNIYHMENQHFSYLLDFALTASNLEKSIVVITVDISNVKDIISRTKRWIKIVQEHVANKIIPTMSAEDSQRCFQRVKDNFKKGQSQSVKDAVDIPVVLDTNIGIPIIIAVTKSDLIEHVADSFCNRRTVVTSRPDHFLNFVLYKLRKLALRYGASLFYTSATSNINCLTLKNYILNVFFNTPFSFRDYAEYKDHTSIAIPSGCDSAPKIKSIDCSTFTSDPENTDLDATLNDIFFVQDSLQQSSTYIDKDPVVDLESFLKKQQKIRNMIQSRPIDNEGGSLISPLSSNLGSPGRHQRQKNTVALTPRASSKLNDLQSPLLLPTPIASDYFNEHSMLSQKGSVTPRTLTTAFTTNVTPPSSDQVEVAEHFFTSLLQRYSNKQTTPTKNSQN